MGINVGPNMKILLHLPVHTHTHTPYPTYPPALEDLNKSGDHHLLVGHLGSGHYDMKLKVYKGINMIFETPLLNLPTSVQTFFMDNTEPRMPAVAVASGPFIYIYKNLRPYFKFTLPHLQVGPRWCSRSCVQRPRKLIAQ